MLLPEAHASRVAELRHDGLRMIAVFDHAAADLVVAGDVGRIGHEPEGAVAHGDVVADHGLAHLHDLLQAAAVVHGLHHAHAPVQDAQEALAEPPVDLVMRHVRAHEHRAAQTLRFRSLRLRRADAHRHASLRYLRHMQKVLRRADGHALRPRLRAVADQFHAAETARVRLLHEALRRPVPQRREQHIQRNKHRLLLPVPFFPIVSQIRGLCPHAEGVRPAMQRPAAMLLQP